MSRWLTATTTPVEVVTIQKEHAEHPESLVQLVCSEAVSGQVESSRGRSPAVRDRRKADRASFALQPVEHHILHIDQLPMASRAPRPGSSRSRSFVNFFSSTRCILRVSTHSPCETTLCCMLARTLQPVNPRSATNGCNMLPRNATAGASVLLSGVIPPAIEKEVVIAGPLEVAGVASTPSRSGGGSPTRPRSSCGSQWQWAFVQFKSARSDSPSPWCEAAAGVAAPLRVPGWPCRKPAASPARRGQLPMPSSSRWEPEAGARLQSVVGERI